jgi:RHH-type transcriptional regulator, rel operon repressor / antitoxin RelB
MKTYSFQAPEEIGKKLELLAAQMDRSKGYLIRKALEEFLEDVEDYLEAKKYKASKEYNPKDNISFEELMKLSGLEDA